MSTKTTPLNALNAATKAATAAAITTTTAISAAPTAMHNVKIKKEIPSDEIKEFAENTMNELLGWYGFDGVDRLDLSTKTSRLLQNAAHAANNASSSNASVSPSVISQHHMEQRRKRNRATTLLQLQQQQSEQLRNMANNNKNINNNNSNNNNNNSNSRKHTLICNNYGGINNNNNNSNNSVAGGSIVGGNESTTSDHDTHSSREDDSKSPHSAGKTTTTTTATTTTTMEEKIDYNNCCWCRRPVSDNAPEFLTTSDGPRYCSESCFTQSRRANFKKAKTCDWCKHVRHAVSYVDFQEGASQLQFCSDKCLNQYKMNIFCNETQAHLDMNPHLREQGLEAAAAGNGAGLITPDLWLRNCRSRSASPASTVSVSPGPQHSSALAISSPRRTPPCSNQLALNNAIVPAAAVAAAAPHKPMISVAPVSKLMSKSPCIMSQRQSPKHSRKKRPLRSSGGADMHVGLKTNHATMSRDLSGSLTTSSLLSKARSLLSSNVANNLHTSPGHMVGSRTDASGKTKAPTLSQFAGSSVQDLHMSVPPLSPMLDQQSPHGMSHAASAGTSIPPAFFATHPTAGALPTQIAANAFAPRAHHFMQNPAAIAAGMLPRFMAGFPGLQTQPTPTPPQMLQTDMASLSALLGTPPPVTVMVPYPIVIPLPIPIPVPLPIMDFYKAYLTPEQREKLKQQEAKQQAAKTPVATDADAERDASKMAQHTNELQRAIEEPLDFTKSKDNAAENALKPEDDAAELANEPLETETPSVRSTPSDDTCSSTSNAKVLHCIVAADDTATTTTTNDLTNNNNNNNNNICNNNNNNDDGENATNSEMCNEATTTLANDDAKQKLPKFKITRLQTKRTLIQTKESECSRPLRKRKRIIDCDFQKIALKEADDDVNANALENVASAASTTTALGVEAEGAAMVPTQQTNACNSNTKANNKKFP